MVFFSDFFVHRSACKRKQDERAQRIARLPTPYLEPINKQDVEIINAPIQQLVHNVQSKSISPVDIIRTYGKIAIRAHEKTNCLTEIMLPEAESWANSGTVNLQGPLAGIPVSLKDSIQVAGYDTSVGYSCYTGQPTTEDGVLARLLKEAGAIPFVKTNLPITLLSFESSNDLWGRTSNPHNSKYSPGGSTGGESALLAFGGSRIGVGSDVAGSVRVPAHFSGCYSLRCSTGRWPKTGINTSMPGQEGIPSVFSPMTRTLDDLVYFTKSFIQTKPWRLDHSVHPLEWRDDLHTAVNEQKKLRIGVLRTDGVVDPSPACARALQEAVAALSKDGHEVFEVQPPSPYEGLRLASLLLNSDGCGTFRSKFRTGEWMDSGAAQMDRYMRLPRPLKYLWYLWVRYVRGDALWAGLLRDWHAKSALQQWQLVAQREAYKAQWHVWWNSQTDPATGAPLDFLLTPPNATPSVPQNGMHDAVSSCGYTFLFNILDYSAGIVPVTHVDAVKDALPPHFSVKGLNGVARGAYKHYDAAAMHGLPVAVQLVGRRLQEEHTLAGMLRLEQALEQWNGGKYRLMSVDVD